MKKGLPNFRQITHEAKNPGHYIIRFLDFHLCLKSSLTKEYLAMTGGNKNYALLTSSFRQDPLDSFSDRGVFYPSLPPLRKACPQAGLIGTLLHLITIRHGYGPIVVAERISKDFCSHHRMSTKRAMSRWLINEHLKRITAINRTFSYQPKIIKMLQWGGHQKTDSYEFVLNRP